VLPLVNPDPSKRPTASVVVKMIDEYIETVLQIIITELPKGQLFSLLFFSPSVTLLPLLLDLASFSFLPSITIVVIFLHARVV